MDEPERPGPEADASEIQEWMDEHFAWSVAEGIRNASVGSDTVTCEILNRETGEVVGTIDTDGNLETESGALREVSRAYVEDGVPVLVPTTYENEAGETVHGDAEVVVSPGTEGFVRAFVDSIPSPFDADSAVLDELPVYDGDSGRAKPDTGITNPTPASLDGVLGVELVHSYLVGLELYRFKLARDEVGGALTNRRYGSDRVCEAKQECLIMVNR